MALSLVAANGLYPLAETSEIIGATINSKYRRNEMTIKRYDLCSRMSQAVVHGDTIYLSGQVADDWTAGIKQQTEEILHKIESILHSLGSDKSKLLSAQIWLADVREFDEMNAVWEGWIDPKNPPARATTGPTLAHHHVRVEIAVIGVL